MTAATYSAPPPVAATSDVTFGYDELGNRTFVNDGPGQVDFGYDSFGLGRLTSETRSFDDLPGQSFTLIYAYNLAGQLKRVTDTRGDYVEYARDKAGRVTDVTGLSFAGVTGYLTGIQYRAWGGAKQAAYGSGFNSSVKYNARLQVAQFDIPGVLGATYDYFSDGRVHTAKAQTDTNTYDRLMDRSFTYDHLGRVNTTRSSGEAGLGAGSTFHFRQDYAYDAFGNMTGRSGNYWMYTAGNENVAFSATYENNKVKPGTVTDGGKAQGWSYDNMGNLTGVTTTDDNNAPVTLQSNSYDAVGRALPNLYNSQRDWRGQAVAGSGQRFIRATPLGGEILTTLDGAGAKVSTNVYNAGGGQLLAEQKMSQQQPSSVTWHHRDPHNTVARDTYNGGGKEAQANSVDPLGTVTRSTATVDTYKYYSCLYAPNSPGCTGQSPNSFYTPNASNYGGSTGPGGYGSACYLNYSASNGCGNSLDLFNDMSKDMAEAYGGYLGRLANLGGFNTGADANGNTGVSVNTSGGTLVLKEKWKTKHFTKDGVDYIGVESEFELVPGGNSTGGSLIDPKFGPDWTGDKYTTTLLRQGFAEIQTQKCRDFVEKTLKDEFGIAAKFDDLLKTAEFNYFNPTRDPQTWRLGSPAVRRMGERNFNRVEDNINKRGMPAAFVVDNKIYATVGFQQPGISQGRVIVHELFHLAGVKTLSFNMPIMALVLGQVYEIGSYEVINDPLNKLDARIKENCAPNGSGK